MQKTRGDKNHPRVPADVAKLVLWYASRVDGIMSARHGIGRHTGWGQMVRLMLIDNGKLAAPLDELSRQRLEAYREVLLEDERAPKPVGPRPVMEIFCRPP